jgi:thioesterase domain-containing protein
MSTPDLSTMAHDLIQFVRREIPLALNMDLQLHSCDDTQITLAAPLPPNINDKGCAFGGSLVSVMTLNGWSLVELALRRRGMDCDVFVAESTAQYLAPVWGDFLSEAKLAVTASWTSFFTTLDTRGRARIGVTCTVPGTDGKPAATLNARFVAKRRA